jgi:hypothetical protein
MEKHSLRLLRESPQSSGTVFSPLGRVSQGPE